ncbi:MAG: hypothetical protein F6K40_12535 [Okeania sp. SIO3I5]|uniref:hypothetical protein n=1 Tax=Okeania sp. SIO3I5 TaxID=2607805 RepID=UPI0013B715E2|nr:hypothetical protein [Okeania sp. SIO3I5]NEQ37057.1 hypothetical protein [Okeania sp. SIO3I5]
MEKLISVNLDHQFAREYSDEFWSLSRNDLGCYYSRELDPDSRLGYDSYLEVFQGYYKRREIEFLEELLREFEELQAYEESELKS